MLIFCIRLFKYLLYSYNTKEKIEKSSVVLVTSMMIPGTAFAYENNPSIQALLNSVVSGAVVVAIIFGALTLVANFDPVTRD